MKVINLKNVFVNDDTYYRTNVRPMQMKAAIVAIALAHAYPLIPEQQQTHIYCQSNFRYLALPFLSTFQRMAERVGQYYATFYNFRISYILSGAVQPANFRATSKRPKPADRVSGKNAADRA